MQAMISKVQISLGERFAREPSQNSSSVQDQVLLHVIRGTGVVLSGVLLLLIIHYIVAGNTRIGWHIGAGLFFMAYSWGAWFLLKMEHARIAGWMMVCFYALFASSILVAWSAHAPIGILLLGFTVFIAGATLGSKVIAPVSITAIVALVFVQIATNKEWINPDITIWLSLSNYASISSYGIVIGAFGLVCWVLSTKTEQHLNHSLAVEKEVRRQKALVAKTLQSRTKILQETQMRETKYLYSFAELGQLSTALLHDLSNHLTVLGLEIDGLDQGKHSQAIIRAQRSIRYLDDMVNQVRAQIHTGGTHRLLDVRLKIQQVIDLLQPKAQCIGVSLQLRIKEKNNTLFCYGDPVRFRYIVTILLTNAIDAYVASSRTYRPVRIVVERQQSMVVIRIIDRGAGMNKTARQKIFKPFYTTKSEGMGIGLFIAKEMLTTHFQGTISLEDRVSPTVFRLQIPLRSEQERSSCGGGS